MRVNSINRLETVIALASYRLSHRWLADSYVASYPFIVVPEYVSTADCVFPLVDVCWTDCYFPVTYRKCTAYKHAVYYTPH